MIVLASSVLKSCQSRERGGCAGSTADDAIALRAGSDRGSSVTRKNDPFAMMTLSRIVNPSGSPVSETALHAQT